MTIKRTQERGAYAPGLTHQKFFDGLRAKLRINGSTKLNIRYRLLPFWNRIKLTGLFAEGGNVVVGFGAAEQGNVGDEEDFGKPIIKKVIYCQRFVIRLHLLCFASLPFEKMDNEPQYNHNYPCRHKQCLRPTPLRLLDGQRVVLNDLLRGEPRNFIQFFLFDSLQIQLPCLIRNKGDFIIAITANIINPHTLRNG